MTTMYPNWKPLSRTPLTFSFVLSFKTPDAPLLIPFSSIIFTAQILYFIPLPLGVWHIFPIFCNQKEMDITKKIHTKLYLLIISSKHDLKKNLVIWKVKEKKLINQGQRDLNIIYRCFYLKPLSLYTAKSTKRKITFHSLFLHVCDTYIFNSAFVSKTEMKKCCFS